MAIDRPRTFLIPPDYLMTEPCRHGWASREGMTARDGIRRHDHIGVGWSRLVSRKAILGQLLTLLIAFHLEFPWFEQLVANPHDRLLFLLILPRRQGMVIRWGGDQKVLVVRRDEIEVPFLYPTLERTIRGCKPSDSETRRQVYQGWFHQKGLGIKGLIGF